MPFSTFTIIFDLPPAPTLTAQYITDPVTGCPAIKLTAQGLLNLLSSDDSSFEGSIGTWTATNAALAQSSTHVLDGAEALRFTPAASGAVTGTTNNSYVVQPNTQYTAVLSDFSGGSVVTIQCQIKWYNSAGTFISSSTGGGVSDSTSVWTQATVTATSPGTAAFASVQFLYTATGTSDIHYVDETGLFLGTTTTWSAGGFIQSAGIVILRSDGLYVRGASTANPLAVNAATQNESVNDYECTPGTTYSYTAQTQVVQSGVTTISAASAAAGASVPTQLGFWELDPTNPASAININPTQWNPAHYEQSTGHVVIGQVTSNIVASAMMNPDLQASFEVFTPQNYTGLLGLCTSQKTIFISDPFGLSYYFRLAVSPGGSSGAMGKAHDTNLQASSAGAPHRIVGVTGVAQPRPQV